MNVFDQMISLYYNRMKTLHLKIILTQLLKSLKHLAERC
jgi:hypothetical protein